MSAPQIVVVVSEATTVLACLFGLGWHLGFRSARRIYNKRTPVDDAAPRR